MGALFLMRGTPVTQLSPHLYFGGGEAAWSGTHVCEMARGDHSGVKRLTTESSLADVSLACADFAS